MQPRSVYLGSKREECLSISFHPPISQGWPLPRSSHLYLPECVLWVPSAEMPRTLWPKSVLSGCPCPSSKLVGTEPSYFLQQWWSKRWGREYMESRKSVYLTHPHLIDMETKRLRVTEATWLLTHRARFHDPKPWLFPFCHIVSVWAPREAHKNILLCMKSLQLCLTLCRRLLCLWDSPGKNPGVGSHALLQGIFPTSGLNPSLTSSALEGRFFTPGKPM